VALFSSLPQSERGGILSRICLMVGAGFDDDSLRRRLHLDCGLDCSPLELDVAKTYLGLSKTAWASAYLKLIQAFGLDIPFLERFDRIRQSAPGEAGWMLGRRLPHISTGKFLGIFPAEASAITAGVRLARRIKPGMSLGMVNCALVNRGADLKASRISAERVLELTLLEEGQDETRFLKTQLALQRRILKRNRRRIGSAVRPPR